MVPFAVERGWAEADAPRRVAAVLALPLALATAVACTAVASAETGWPAFALWLVWLVVGPATHHSLARVLRPHPVEPRSRTVRHLLASAAAALGAPLLWLLVLQPQDGEPVRFVVLAAGWGLPAASLAAVTALWGLVVASRR